LILLGFFFGVLLREKPFLLAMCPIIGVFVGFEVAGTFWGDFLPFELLYVYILLAIGIVPARLIRRFVFRIRKTA
jgi:hypothetical protein